LARFDELDAMGDSIGKVYADCVDRLLVNIARHFKYLQPGEEPGGALATRRHYCSGGYQPPQTGCMHFASQWQARKLAELGQVNRENVEIIRRLLGDMPAELAEGLTRKQSTGLFPASLGRSRPSWTRCRTSRRR